MSVWLPELRFFSLRFVGEEHILPVATVPRDENAPIAAMAGRLDCAYECLCSHRPSARLLDLIRHECDPWMSELQFDGEVPHLVATIDLGRALPEGLTLKGLGGIIVGYYWRIARRLG